MDSVDYSRYDSSYKVLRGILAPLFRLGYHPEYFGLENIPKEGAVIICSNHRYLTDSGYMALSTDRAIHFLAKKELHSGAFGWFFRLAGTISVDRSRSHSGALEAAEGVLQQGEIIGIYPEGTRNKTAEAIMPLKFGAVRMAQVTGAPIVPMAFVRGKRVFLDKSRVYIGKPYHIARDADLEQENRKLREKLKSLYETGKE